MIEAFTDSKISVQIELSFPEIGKAQVTRNEAHHIHRVKITAD